MTSLDLVNLSEEIESLGRSPGYSDARLMAGRGTALPIATFPLDCPYTAAQALDGAWLPPVDEPAP